MPDDLPLCEIRTIIRPKPSYDDNATMDAALRCIEEDLRLRERVAGFVGALCESRLELAAFDIETSYLED